MNVCTAFRRLSLFTLFSFLPLSAFPQTGLVISQVYGGGGNSGATYKYDFVELYNAGSTAVDLSAYSIQYASATGSSWSAVNLSGTIQPGSYFLARGCTGNNASTAPDLPIPSDFDYPNYNNSSACTGNLSATSGKVALVSNQTALSGIAATATAPLGGVSCPSVNTAAIVDLVGYGTATCYEGTGAAPVMSVTTADSRSAPPANSSNNSADFSSGTPTPHDSSGAVATPPAVVFIHDIQGVKSTTGFTISLLVGQQVQTTGVVTTVLSNAFFIQSRDSDADANPLTPEGIEVYTSSAPTVAIGNYVQVTGTVATYPSPFPATNGSHTPATEITSPTVTVLTPSVPLPAPIALTSSMLTPSGGLYQLTPYEGMRVSVASLTSVSGTNGSITSANEPTETATSTGYFYAVITGTARPFREPGIDIRDVPVPGAPANVPSFNDNPERILVDSVIAGGTSLEISTGAVLPNVTGVLDFTFSQDQYYDPSRLILDASYDRTQVTAGMTVQPVPLPAADEFTVASFNIERFYNTNSADDIYYVPAGVDGYNGSSSTPIVSTGQTFTSEAVDVTQTAYTRRLQKVSLAIRTVLNSPDIVTLEEVENQSVANDIANQINTDAGVPNLYTAYSTDNTNFYTQDGTGISVGFLVKNTVDTLAFTQVGAGETFTPTNLTTNTPDSLTTLNDRPWLAINAGIKRGTGIKDYSFVVVVNHMKALSGINSTTTNSTRLKKELQAEDIAKFIQGLQANKVPVISGGDFNAFEFSDGYTDTLATYTNTNVLPSNEVVQPGVSGVVTPPLVDLALQLPAEQRWSYAEDGNAQILDHMVVTQDLATAGAHLAYAHFDADFPLTAYNDATTPARSSDHDAAVGYFAIPAPVFGGVLSPTSGTFPATIIGSTSVGQAFIFTNLGEGPVSITSIAVTGPFTETNNCGTSVAISTSCTINVIFTPTAAGAQTGQLSLATNISGNAFTSSLSGTGTVSPDFTVGDNKGSTSTSVTVTAGSTASVPLTFTPNSTFTGTLSLTCAIASGTAPAGVTCNVPASFPLSGSASKQTVTFTTTSRTTTSGLSLPGGGSRWIAASVLSLAGLIMLFAARSRRLGNIAMRGAGFFLLLLAICLPAAGCGGSGSPTPTPNPNGTPAGSYNYNVTATSGTISHVESVTLVVQ